MTLDLERVRRCELRNHTASWTDRDSIAYALAVGFGRNGKIPAELPFIYEGRGLRAVPTFATTLAVPDFPTDCGWNHARVLHAAHSLEIFSALAPADDILIDSTVVDAYDRGENRGCTVVTLSEGRRKRDNRALFASTATWIAPADQGGGETRPRAAIHPLPRRRADFIDDTSVRPDQAYLYRLCGDRNPLHADPDAARDAGFEQPILHGLCTYGIACRSVLKTVCDYDATLITEFTARFTAPVYPGDSLRIDMWQDGAVVSFRVKARNRDSVVLDNGRCTLAS